MSIVSATPEAYYTGVDIQFYKSLVAKRAIIEVIHLCFAPDAQTEIAQAKDKLLSHFDEVNKMNKDDAYGSSCGWSLEMGRRQRGWAMIVGWPNFETCTKFRNSPESQASIEELRKTPGLLKFESYMAPLQPYPSN